MHVRSSAASGNKYGDAHVYMRSLWCICVRACYMLQGLITSSSPWETSLQRLGSKIVIDGATITKTEQSWAHGTAVISDGVTLQHGSSIKKRWSFKIKKGTQQTIGVVTAMLLPTNTSTRQPTDGASTKATARQATAAARTLHMGARSPS